MSIGIKNIGIEIESTDLKEKISKGFRSMSLSQSIGNHHTLTLVFRKDEMEDESSLVSKSLDYLGKNISLSITTEESEVTKKEEKLTFKGIVTGISVGKTSSFAGDSVLITASSPEIVMDDGAHAKSFEEKDLKEIVCEVFDDYGISTESVKPKTKTGKHGYIVQYRETSHNFVTRLASKYGQWFFYDGEKLHFGELEKIESIKLVYGKNLFGFNLQVKTEPFTFGLVGYDYKDTGKQKYDSKDDSQNVSLSELGKKVAKQSDDLFTHKSSILYNHSLEIGNQQSHLDHRVELKKAGKASGMVICTGETDNPLLKIGSVIKISEIINDNETNHGDFIVVNLEHSADRSGEYSNSFTAIPGECEIPFTANPHSIPVCETQSAIVTENVDTEKMGRVRVRFFWQKDGEQTPWIRIVNPYSGKEKGQMFIPEVEEEVLVGFEGGNAEKPFVIGTMYHAKAKPESWDNTENNIKAIRTRSGHTIEFRDNDGEEEVWLYDYNKENYFIKMKSHSQEITIEAVEHIQLKSKNISILADEDLKIEATDVYNTTNGNIESDVSGNLKSSVSGNVENTISGNLDNSITGNISTEANGNISNKSTGDTTNESSANMTVKGGINTTVEAGAKATIKASAQIEESAGIININ